MIQEGFASAVAVDSRRALELGKHVLSLASPKANVFSRRVTNAMTTIMVRYKTKPGRAAENAQFIERVFEDLKRNAPDGVRYASFRLGDGVTFVHIASVETADGRNPLTESAAFKEFLAGIGDRCDEPPIASDLTMIGSYRLFS